MAAFKTHTKLTCGAGPGTLAAAPLRPPLATACRHRRCCVGAPLLSAAQLQRSRPRWQSQRQHMLCTAAGGGDGGGGQEEPAAPIASAAVFLAGGTAANGAMAAVGVALGDQAGGLPSTVRHCCSVLCTLPTAPALPAQLADPPSPSRPGCLGPAVGHPQHAGRARCAGLHAAPAGHVLCRGGLCRPRGRLRPAEAHVQDSAHTAAARPALLGACGTGWQLSLASKGLPCLHRRVCLLAISSLQAPVHPAPHLSLFPQLPSCPTRHPRLALPAALQGLGLLALGAGVGEETLFRAFMQEALCGGLADAAPSLPTGVTTAAGVAVASLVFGWLHALTPTYLLFATGAGALFGEPVCGTMIGCTCAACQQARLCACASAAACHP